MKVQLVAPSLVLAWISGGAADVGTKAASTRGGAADVGTKAVSTGGGAADVGTKAASTGGGAADVGTKAASTLVNYNCQCDSLTFADKYGNIHGNCKSADSSGALWCYLPLYVQTSCSDHHNSGHQSSRFPNAWSYEACATPPVSGSYTGNLCVVDGIEPRNNNNDNNDKAVDGKAASQQVNYGCQCDSLTFQDKNGNIHGNCKSADDTFAAWCYLPLGSSSSCSDQGSSSRFPNKWSYEACATPAVSSSIPTVDKAASNQVNYGCQCHHLTFKDQYGNVQGNCKSSDSTGARWCYLPLGCSTCSDQQNSNRFANKWSYEACATPANDYYDDNSINQRINPNNDDLRINDSDDISKINFSG